MCLVPNDSVDEKKSKVSNLHLVVDVGDVADDSDAFADVDVAGGGITFVVSDVIVGCCCCDDIMATLVCVTYKLDFFELGSLVANSW